MAAVSLTLLGAFEVLRDGVPVTHFRGDKVRALLAYLAVEADRPHARPTLAALLWPDHSDELALRNLAQAHQRLRGALGDTGALLDSSRHALQWRGDDDAVDVAAFRRLARSTDGADLALVAELYRGEFLAGFSVPGCEAFDEWLLLTREQLAQQALAALQRLAEQHLAGGRLDAAAHAARRQFELDPWREEAQRQLMRALAGSGNRAAALAAYDHCRRALRDTLGVEPDIETEALAERIRAGDLAPATLRSPVPVHRLPAQLTPFVGRERELAELVARLRHDDARLLTLVGAGGMGKTRLALEVVRNLLADPAADGRATPGAPGLSVFPDGVFFVALAPLTTAAAMAPTIATTIGLPLHDDPKHALLNVLHDKRLLLVLDNVEHLLNPSPGSNDAGVELVLEILRTAPGVRLIATSRERLNLRGEQTYLVEGMEYATEDTATSSAVRLFVQSARRALPGFRLSDANTPQVVRLCRLVQGMPLGLELAAAWVETVPLDTIAAEIERNADFLTFDWRDAPERQRSMRAVFDWSWHLLTDAERQAALGLSVFRGGCTREAAQAVLDAPLRVLTSLTHKSLLRWVQAHGAAGRYEVHELLRQFAAEQLAAIPDEHAATRRRHAAYYLDYVAAREASLAYNAPREAALEIRGELDNIRHAWSWAVAQRQFSEVDRCACGWWQFCFLTGRWFEGERAFRLAVERIQADGADAIIDAAARHGDQRLLSKLLAYHAALLNTPGNTEEALRNAQHAVALAHASGGGEGEAIGSYAWAKALVRAGRHREARDRMEHALQVSLEYQGRYPPHEVFGIVEWQALVWLQAINVRLGEYAAAWRYGTRALDRCRGQGRRFGEVSCLGNRADVARAIHDLPTARSDYERPYASRRR